MLVNVKQFVNSKKYKDADAKVRDWKGRLEHADMDETVRVRDEKAEFFLEMQKSDPELYAAFQIDDKALSEIIFRKFTGKDIVID